MRTRERHPANGCTDRSIDRSIVAKEPAKDRSRAAEGARGAATRRPCSGGRARLARERDRGQQSVLEYWRSMDLKRRAQSSPDLDRRENRNTECLEPGGESPQIRDQTTPDTEISQATPIGSESPGGESISPVPARDQPNLQS